MIAPRISKTLSLVSGKLSVKRNKQTATSINLTLPEDTNSYFQTQNNVAQLQEANIPKIVLTLTTPDGKPLDSTAVIKSTQ